MTTRILPNFAGRDHSQSNCPSEHDTNVQQDLQFVNLPHNLKLDIAARRRVRSHVARDFRRRAKVPGSSSLDIELNAAKGTTREGVLGQKHRFRFGQQGLQETGKQATRKSTTRKVSSISQDSLLPKPSVVRSPNATEDPGGTGGSESPGLQTTVATEEFIPSVSVDASYSSNSIWDESYASPSRSNTSVQCCTTAQKSTDPSGNSQLVCRAKTGQNYPSSQQLHLAMTVTGNIDPFNSVPIIDSSCRTQTLMHHFHLRIMASPLMMNPRKEWFSLAIQDHALFHVALSHAAGNLGLLMQKGDSVESLLHRMEAIRIINERLSNLSNGISDGTISAVASMASYEATNGTLEGVQTHMNGLEQMVRTRGGLLGGGFSAHLHRLIAWADLNCANALSTAPRFPPLSDREHLQSDQFAIDPIAFQLYSTPLSTLPTSSTTNQSTAATLNDFSSNPYSSITSTYKDIQVLAPKLGYCFITLRQLSRLLNISGPKAVIRMDHTWYSDMAYTLQRRLMHLGDTFSSQPSRIERPSCIGALIYLECCIREIHPRSRIVETLVKDLKAALLKLKGLASKGMSNLVFWALAVGVAASGSQAEHEWFVAQLGALCGFLAVRGWDGAKEILQGILWPERDSELTRALVWAEVEMADNIVDCWTVGSD